MEFAHTSVLLEEVLEGLCIKENGVYVDGTLGGGGHSYEIASRLKAGGRLIGIDQDGAAVDAASKRLRPFGDTVTIVRDNYKNISSVLDDLHINKADGILLDLGVSSYQLDEAERGFAYRTDAPLDMRMDQRQTKTAADIVNQYSEGELFRMIRDYGEERYAGSIARNIIRERQKERIETTGRLSDIIKSSIPMKARRTGGHPAKRTFQAIRIELNDELTILNESLDQMIELLNDGGRLCVITFHSLEDRIVKNAFRSNEHPCICPPDFPVCVCGRISKGKVITRKPITADDEERERNPRSESAKLRIFERIYPDNNTK